ncbi:MAG: hypothetical protein LBL79_06885 [Prevotella sp.]|nr:hypothetical protein [Prevotella sp.]
MGRVVNKGWEITATYTKKTGDFTFDAGANFSKYKSEVKSLGKYTQMKHTNSVNKLDPFYSFVGYPWTSYNLIKTGGIFKSQEEIDSHTWYNPETGRDEKIQPQAKTGDLRFVDINNDGKINDDDRILMGAYDNPDFFYGFNLGASWKDLSINMQFQGVAGVKIFNGVKAMTYAGDKGTNMSRDVLKSYNYNTESGIPNLAIVSDENGNYTTVSDFFLEKGDYFRMKSLNISYSLPKHLSSLIGLKGTGVRFYFNADNLFTVTGYKGFDPEVGNNGLDNGRYPVARTFSFGLNVTL